MKLADSMAFALWAEHLPAGAFTVNAIRQRWACSRATAYRLFSAYMAAWREVRP
jgi:hypothetical protein